MKTRKRRISQHIEVPSGTSGSGRAGILPRASMVGSPDGGNEDKMLVFPSGLSGPDARSQPKATCFCVDAMEPTMRKQRWNVHFFIGIISLVNPTPDQEVSIVNRKHSHKDSKDVSQIRGYQ